MPDAAGPLITLTTDFGTDDFYVGAMKGAMFCHCPRATLVDITHGIPRQDVLFGSIVLERVMDAYPPETVHLAVVDPGVGTSRRILIAQWPGQTAVCPDNGLITWAWRRRGPARLWELTWRPPASSAVFHGRDIMGPAAAMLASGTDASVLGRPCEEPVLLEIEPATQIAAGARVIYIDRFGNATTNVPVPLVNAVRSVSILGRALGPVLRTYADVARGAPLALIGSSNLLEIAVREGSAADQLGLKVGDIVDLHED